jgi:hypothetical protein
VDEDELELDEAEDPEDPAALVELLAFFVDVDCDFDELLLAVPVLDDVPLLVDDVLPDEGGLAELDGFEVAAFVAA